MQPERDQRRRPSVAGSGSTGLLPVIDQGQQVVVVLVIGRQHEPAGGNCVWQREGIHEGESFGCRAAMGQQQARRYLAMRSAKLSGTSLVPFAPVAM